jgi:hypothetical protein
MSLGVINHGMSLFVLYLNIHTVPIADTIRCHILPPIKRLALPVLPVDF